MSAARADERADTLATKGEQALASGLWAIAAGHFDECLKIQNLDPATQAKVTLGLVEAWIREGKAAEAIELVKALPESLNQEATFWKGQAQLALGAFQDAVTTLTPLAEAPDSRFHAEAGFTIASLLLSLGNEAAALDSLARLAKSADPAVATKAKLREVEIMLDLGRTAEAREIMPDSAGIAATETPLATFLEAQLLLAEGKPEDATTTFRSLIEQPVGQTLLHYHATAVGLADALLASGKPDEAQTFLLTFIGEHPESPLLDAMFKRILAWLPEKPAANDPVLERLTEWISPPTFPSTGPLDTLAPGAVAAWPVVAETNDLQTFAIYIRAVGLLRVGTPETSHQARQLLTRLRLENPGHFLADRALFETARSDLENGKTESAFHALNSLIESANSPALRGEAAFLEALQNHHNGDNQLAIKLFDQAAALLSNEAATAARINAAVIRLKEATGGRTPEILNPQENRKLSSELQLERALSLRDPREALTAIEAFLISHPTHPRAAEARLFAAQAALTTAKPDLSYAKAQLATLDSSGANNLDPLQLQLVRLRIEDLSGDPKTTIATARDILKTYPENPETHKAAFILGRNLFETRNFNEARLVLEKLANSETHPQRAQAALLLAARSSALVPTSQSQQEALTLFDKVIAQKSELAPVAFLEKSRLMIDMNRLTEATSFIRGWFDTLPPTDPIHLPAGLLLGEAIYAQGSVNPESLQQALAVYDELLLHSEKFPSIRNRIQYLRGRTLEQIPDPENPQKTKEKQAFQAYYSVLETDTTPAEWHHFELCGFRALALLEKAGRWPAAIACARKIASFNGPRAKEAATRASQLQLKHMIWED
ncbi:MAG: tetratricopeptide repeat protein [Verrucomicrobiales bacterium]|nr:tetratricopeptide repeat protein [Verrucomicrobiota bacterium JB025]